MSMYLIKRGPKPAHHVAPYSPVIVCANKKTAQWEAGWTGDRAWVWQFDGPLLTGLLLTRWEGLDIDYGHTVRGNVMLTDGSVQSTAHLGFHHYCSRPKNDKQLHPWDLFAGAVWWSTRPLPKWLAERGVVLASDEWTKATIKRVEGYSI